MMLPAVLVSQKSQISSQVTSMATSQLVKNTLYCKLKFLKRPRRPTLYYRFVINISRYGIFFIESEREKWEVEIFQKLRCFHNALILAFIAFCGLWYHSSNVEFCISSVFRHIAGVQVFIWGDLLRIEC